MLTLEKFSLGVGDRFAHQAKAQLQACVTELLLKHAYHVDADHINLETVDRFIEASDFYTLDVAAAIGQPAEADRVEAFTGRHPELLGTVSIPGIGEPFTLDREA